MDGPGVAMLAMLDPPPDKAIRAWSQGFEDGNQGRRGRSLLRQISVPCPVESS